MLTRDDSKRTRVFTNSVLLCCPSETLLISTLLEIGLENRFFFLFSPFPSLPSAAVPNDYCHLQAQPHQILELRLPAGPTLGSSQSQNPNEAAPRSRGDTKRKTLGSSPLFHSEGRAQAFYLFDTSEF